MDIKEFSIREGAGKYSGQFTYHEGIVEIPPDRIPCGHALRIKTSLVFTRKERGEHTTLIRLVDELGEEIAKSLPSIYTIEVPPEKNSTETESICEFVPVVFPHVGTYTMILNVDGEDKESRLVIVQEL